MSDLLNQASLVMIPSGYKEDTVFSQLPQDGTGDLTFTRASNGTRVNSAGLVEVAPWNLQQYSEDFSNAIWNKSNVTITTNDTTAPNGTTTADKIAQTSGGYVNGSATGTGGNSYVFSVYLKAGSVSSIRLRESYYYGTNSTFNLSAGTATGTGVIENVGNGWFRCSLPQTYLAGEIELSYIIDITTVGDYYAWGAQINIGSTAKPYFPTTDRLNVPRLTYQNGGGGCPSLLLEKQSTNLLSYSEDFSNGYWELGSVATITTNTIVSPDGTQNADTLTANGTGSLFVRRNVYLGTAQTCSNSLFVKKANNRYVGFRNSGTVSNHDVFDFDTKTWTNNSGATLSYDEFPNGWFRLKSTNTDAVNLNYYWSVIPAVNTSGVESTTASNLSVYIWGGQAEQNANYITSYIPTTSSSATRVADACYKTGISSLIGQSEGFIAGEVYGLTSAYGALSTIMSVSDGTTQNRVMFSFNPSTGYLTPRIYKAGSTIFVQDYYLGDLTQKIKFAIGWGGGRAVCYVNGTQVQETTGLTFFSSGTLTRLGADQGDGGSIGIGKVSEYILGTTNLTNSQLQSLTL